jgi:hypothetical protein
MTKQLTNTALATSVGAVLALSLGYMMTAHAADAPTHDVDGSYVISMEYLGSDYLHDMTLSETDGVLTGNGGSPAGSNVYTWTIASGTVSGDTIDFYANYTATPDAVTPQTVLHVVGTVAEDGTMSGTWSDNYQGGNRSGTWETVSGTATPIDIEETPDPKDVCKDGGWKTIGGHTFKNQGQCVSWVNAQHRTE